MTIRNKMIAIGAMTAALSVGAELVLQWLLVGPSFDALERIQATERLAHARRILLDEQERIAALCEAWARGPEEAVPVSAEGCASNQLSFMATVRKTGEVARWAGWNAVEQTPLLFSDLPREQWDPKHPLVAEAMAGGKARGPFMTHRGPLLSAAQPMNDGSVLLIGRLILPAVLKELTRSANLDMEFIPGQSRTGGERRFDPMTVSGTVLPDGRLRATEPYPDLQKKPVFELGVRIPRTISSQGRLATRWAVLGGLCIGLVSLLFLLVMLRRAVTEPMGRLIHHVGGIRESGRLEFVNIGARKDEFGVLADEFNRMLAKIEHDAEQHRKMREQLEAHRRLAEIGELGASVAHEIRNPLAGISGALQVIQGSLPQEDPRADAIAEALAQVNRVETAVRQLLEYAKPWHPALQEADLRAFTMDRAASWSRHPALETCTVTIQSGPPLWARFDPQLIGQVLDNLLINASDAMNGPGRIEIVFSTENGLFHTHVRDQGPGFSQSSLERAFEPFFTTKTRGVGLGLAVCRRIIEAHGGTVSVANCAEGAEAVFSLPAKEGAWPQES